MTPRFPLGDDTLWFVYSNENQSGPFSTPELATRINRREFDKSVHVWTQGLEDWTTAADIPGFAGYCLDIESFQMVADEDAQASMMARVPDMALAETEFIVDDSPFVETSFATATSKPVVQEAATTEIETPLPTRKEKAAKFLKHYRLHLAVALACIASVIGIWISSSNSALSRIQGDVAVSDYRDMRRTMGESARLVGTIATVSISSTTPETPRFYIATNASEGTRFEVAIEGVPESMVGRFFYSMQTVVVIKDGIVQTPRLQEKNGALIHPGLYRVSVRVPGQIKPIALKTFFLGGSDGADYERNLEEYHTKLRDQAASEVVELRQLADTAMKVSSDSSTWFAEMMKRARSSAQRSEILKAWGQRNSEFGQMNSQFAAMEAAWTPTALATEIFYSDLYSTLKETLAHMRKAHTQQGEFLNSKRLPDAKSDELLKSISLEALSVQTKGQAILKSVSEIESRTQRSVRGKGLPARL